jgi:hypothetical protein
MVARLERRLADRGPLSFEQQRLWLLHRWIPETRATLLASDGTRGDLG